MKTDERIHLLRATDDFAAVNSCRNVIAEWIPNVASMFDYDQNNSYHPYDLWEHCVRTELEIPKDTTDDMVFLAALLHDIGKPESRCAGRKEEDTFRKSTVVCVSKPNVVTNGRCNYSYVGKTADSGEIFYM